MKRICFLLRSHVAQALGGAELQSYYIAQELGKRGWDVHCIAEKGGQVLGQHCDNGIPVHWLPERARGCGLANYWHLSRVLREVSPDVIYQRVALDYTGIAGALARKYRIKYVWAAAANRDFLKPSYQHLVRNYRNPLKQMAVYIKLLGIHCLVSYGISRSDIAIVQSNDQQKLLLTRWPMKLCAVIKNGHPICNAGETKPRMPSVLWIANIKHWKRVDLYVDLAKRCQDLPAKFYIIGRDQNRSIESLLSSERVHNVEYLGAMTVAEVERHLERADLLVNTSDKDYEGFPNTFIQAWMRKTPVVSLHVDPDDVIKSHGLGFHSGSFGRMVDDVRLILMDQELRREMGENACGYATTEHDLETTVNALERVLNSLV